MIAPIEFRDPAVLVVAAGLVDMMPEGRRAKIIRHATQVTGLAPADLRRRYDLVGGPAMSAPTAAPDVEGPDEVRQVLSFDMPTDLANLRGVVAALALAAEGLAGEQREAVAWLAIAASGYVTDLENARAYMLAEMPHAAPAI